MRNHAPFFGVVVTFSVIAMLGMQLGYMFPALASPNSAEIGSKQNPVPVGGVGELTDGNARLLKLGISEVVRGQAAWRRIQQADPFNRLPAPGKEYLMAFVVVRNLSGTAGTQPGLFSFQVVTAHQTLDDDLSVSGVRPDFRVESSPDMPGGGWIVREVYVSDSAPLLLISLQAHADNAALYFATAPDAR